MSVLRFEIAYDGTHFHGWQIQPEVRTVQGDFTDTLQRIYRVPLSVNGASRTDAGVHARGQVVSMPDPPGRRLIGEFELHRGLTSILPPDISVLRLERVGAVDHLGRPYHARHSARGKIYRYKLWTHRIPDPFEARTRWTLRRSPDPAFWRRMREAARKLEGEHDFAGFRASSCEALKTVRHIHSIQIITPPAGRHDAEIVVQGTAFLKNMVRILVGTMVDIAYGRLPVSIIDEIFATGDRTLSGLTAPAHGLTLEEIFYPDFPWQRPRFSTPLRSADPPKHR